MLANCKKRIVISTGHLSYEFQVSEHITCVWTVNSMNRLVKNLKTHYSNPIFIQASPCHLSETQIANALLKWQFPFHSNIYHLVCDVTLICSCSHFLTDVQFSVRSLWLCGDTLCQLPVELITHLVPRSVSLQLVCNQENHCACGAAGRLWNKQQMFN